MIGERVFRRGDHYCRLRRPVIIGSDVLISEGVYITSRNHRFRDNKTAIREQGYKAKPVVIESDCWIAWGVAILPGARVKTKTILGSNTVAQDQTQNIIRKLVCSDTDISSI